MIPNVEYRRLVITIGNGHRGVRSKKPLWHESLGTMMLGTLSTSVGIAVLASLVARRPSFDILLTAYIGQLLGMAGMLLARRAKRGQAPLSIIGAVICFIPLAPFYLALFIVLLAIVTPIALLLYGVHILNRSIRS